MPRRSSGRKYSGRKGYSSSKSDNSGRHLSSTGVRFRTSYMFGSTFTGVTTFNVNPLNAGFGSHCNYMASLHQEFCVESLELEAFPNGVSMAAGYSPVINAGSSLALGDMSSLEKFTFYAGQQVTKPYKLTLNRRDLSQGPMKRYFTTAQTITDLSDFECYQGQIYLYHGSSATVQYRLTVDIRFYSPVSYNLLSGLRSTDEEMKVVEPPPPTPIEPAQDKKDEKGLDQFVIPSLVREESKTSIVSARTNHLFPKRQ